jgi:hypothetical protein
MSLRSLAIGTLVGLGCMLSSAATAEMRTEDDQRLIKDDVAALVNWGTSGKSKPQHTPIQASCAGGYGSCGGYCNPANRSGFDCGSSQRPCYQSDGNCYCVSFTDCQ